MSDLEGICMRKQGGCLCPTDIRGEEVLGAIPQGREVIVNVRKPRSPEHHRFFFALLRKVVQNTDDFGSEEELLDALKLAAGHVNVRATLDGETYLAPKSINFASLDQEAFKRFYNRAVYLLADRVLHCDPEELMKEAKS